MKISTNTSQQRTQIRPKPVFRFSVSYFLGALLLNIFISPIVDRLRSGALIETMLITLLLLCAVLSIAGGRRALVGVVLVAASKKGPGSKSMPTVPEVSRSVSGMPAFIDPRAGRAKLAPQMNGARLKPRNTGILQIPVERQTMIKTHGNFVGRLTTKNYNSDYTPFHRLLP